MDKLDEAINNLKPNIWYPKDGILDKYWIEKIKEKYFDYDFELTFNRDFTKIKKTIWENGKPKYFTNNKTKIKNKPQNVLKFKR